MLTNKDAWLFESSTDDDFGDFVSAPSTEVPNKAPSSSSSVQQLEHLFASPTMSFSATKQTTMPPALPTIVSSTTVHPVTKKSVAPSIMWSPPSSSSVSSTALQPMAPVKAPTARVADLLSLDFSEPAVALAKNPIVDIFTDFTPAPTAPTSMGPSLSVASPAISVDSFASFTQTVPAASFVSPMTAASFVSPMPSASFVAPVPRASFASPPIAPPSKLIQNSPASVSAFADFNSAPLSSPKLNITKTLVRHWCAIVKHVENACNHAITLTEQINAAPELSALAPQQKLALLQQNTNALRYLSGICKMQKCVMRLRARTQMISEWPQSSLHDQWQFHLSTLNEKCRAVEQSWQPVFGFSFQSTCIASLASNNAFTAASQATCCICANADVALNEPHFVHFARRTYHATCANLWLHAASMTLPELCNEDDLDLE